MMTETIDNIVATEGHGESPDGLISVVVGMHGKVRTLDVDPRIYRERDPDALAAAIVAAVGEACDDFDRQAFRLAAPLLPAGVRPEDVDVAFDIPLAALDRAINGR